jgi:hypothetical protein
MMLPTKPAKITIVVLLAGHSLIEGLADAADLLHAAATHHRPLVLECLSSDQILSTPTTILILPPYFCFFEMEVKPLASASVDSHKYLIVSFLIVYETKIVQGTLHSIEKDYKKHLAKLILFLNPRQIMDCSVGI